MSTYFDWKNETPRSPRLTNDVKQEDHCGARVLGQSACPELPLLILDLDLNLEEGEYISIFSEGQMVLVEDHRRKPLSHTFDSAACQ